MDVLSTDDYLRQRLEPRAGDPVFLHLLDLRDALHPFSSNKALTILDYGCGGSPYRGLFPNAIYHRADHPSTSGIDFPITDDSLLSNLSDGSYDLVLSTQVLEHVPQVQVYLTEAHRLLKPGGHLLLTTHGTYQDHACPHDYWRWTAEGLQAELVRAGFTINHTVRLTCGLRAGVFLFGQLVRWTSAKHLGLKIILKLLRSILRPLEAIANRLTKNEAIETTELKNSIRLSIGLLVQATKS